MNNSFYKLSKEKQINIVNAGLKYFGKYDYQKANTAAIAETAGISKALLFYYFKNKKDYFLFLCDYCKTVSESLMDNEKKSNITDFFEMVDFAIETKIKIIEQYPYFTDFTLKVFHSSNKDICNMPQNIETMISNSFNIYFNNIDFSKFKEGINPKEIYRMIIYLSEGYLSEELRKDIPININNIMQLFKKWKDLFKKMCYKVEYLL